MTPSSTLYNIVSFSSSASAFTYRFLTFGSSFYMAVISWKCVANKQSAPISVAMCSAIAQARPKPSFVDVPLPSSSMMIKLLDDAVLSMQEASNISDMKVEIPRS